MTFLDPDEMAALEREMDRLARESYATQPLLLGLGCPLLASPLRLLVEDPDARPHEQADDAERE